MEPSDPNASPPTPPGWAAPDVPPDVPAASVPPSSAAGPAGPDPRGSGAAGRVPLPVPLRPMTTADVVDGSFAILKARPRTIVVIAAVFVVPLELFTAYLNRRNYTDDIGDVFSANNNTDMGALVLAMFLGWLIAPFVAAAIAHVVASWYADGDLSSSDALGRMVRQFFPLMGAFIGVHILELFGILVGLLPVVTLFVVTAPAIAIEDLGPIAGMKRSVALVRTRFSIIGIIVVSMLIEFVIGFAIGAVPQLFASLLTERFDWIIIALFNMAAGIITTSFVAGVSVLLYLDLRVRSEAMDLMMLADEHFEQVEG